MTAVAMRRFDLVDYIDKSRALGVSEDVAKFQARRMEELLEIAVNNTLAETEARELATRQDLINTENALRKDLINSENLLKLEIEKNKSELKQDILKSKIELVFWVAGMFIASGLIQHFFK